MSRSSGRKDEGNPACRWSVGAGAVVSSGNALQYRMAKVLGFSGSRGSQVQCIASITAGSHARCTATWSCSCSAMAGRRSSCSPRRWARSSSTRTAAWSRALARQARARPAAAVLRVVGGQRELVREVGAPAAARARHLHYEDYLLNDVVPFVRHLTGRRRGRRHRLQLRRLPRDDDGAAPSRTPSPRASRWAARSTSAQFLDGYFDEDCYFLNPPSFLPGLGDP